MASLAASPSGREVAMVVYLQPRKKQDLSSVLYLLEEDGSVRTVDAVREFKTLESPIFLRAPTELEGAIRLYWNRFRDEILPETGRLNTQPMVLDGEKLREIESPLRYDEAIFEFHGYPGSSTFSLSLFRHSDVPARLEILRNHDFPEAEAASLTFWAYNQSVVDTDVLVGVAWPSPFEYVVPVANENHKRSYSLRYLRVGCEFLGSSVVYEGNEIDFGYSETPWEILGGPNANVFVLLATNVTDVFEGKTESIPWFSLGLEDGGLEGTKVMWSPGAWTFALPDRAFDAAREPHCERYNWTWP